MTFIVNQWYGAIWSQDLGDAPVARRLLGKPIVLFRTDDGVAALADVCPHRFVPLHLGKVVDGRAIRCGYHGLEFDRTGACVRNPHNAGRIPPAAKVESHQVAERHGMVWIWMGERDADPSLIPDYSFLDSADPQHISARDHLEIRSNYRTVVENLLDLSHASILHDGILGNDEALKAESEVEEQDGDLTVRRYMRDIPAPLLLDLLYKGDGSRVDHWADIRLMGVSNLLNTVGIAEPYTGRGPHGTGMRGAHILTPIDDATTLYQFCAVRMNPIAHDPERDAEIRDQLSRVRKMAFAEQDGPMMEAQQRLIQDPAVDTSRPALFDIDLGASRFARRHDKMLKADVSA